MRLDLDPDKPGWLIEYYQIPLTYILPLFEANSTLSVSSIIHPLSTFKLPGEVEGRQEVEEESSDLGTESWIITGVYNINCAFQSPLPNAPLRLFFFFLPPVSFLSHIFYHLFILSWSPWRWMNKMAIQKWLRNTRTHLEILAHFEELVRHLVRDLVTAHASLRLGLVTAK